MGEDRIKPLPIQGKKIDFLTFPLDDIVIAKLFSCADYSTSPNKLSCCALS